MVASSYFWKLALAVALVAMVVASASARPPRKPLPRAELRWPLSAALLLYGVGGLALLEHHSELAVWLFAAGIITSALAGWLSRGDAGGGSPPGDDPVGEQPPPDPNGAPWFDWEAFERDLQAWSERRRRAGRAPVSTP